MAVVGKAGEYGHNNADYAFVDSNTVRGGARTPVANLTALYALATKVDQLKQGTTIVKVLDIGDGTSARYELVNITDITAGVFNPTAWAKVVSVPQPLGPGDSPSFAGLSLSGNNPLIVNKTTIDSTAPIQANQVGIPDNHAIHVLEMSVSNIEGKKASYIFQAASLPYGADDVVNVFGMPGSGASNPLALLSDIPAITGKVDNTTTVNGKALTSNITLNTDDVQESVTPTNKYYTAARALGTVLSAISFGAVSAVVATDSILIGIGKLQAQITDIYSTKADKIASFNPQTGAYTFVSSDANKVVRINSSTPVSVTIPANSSVAFSTGTPIIVRNIGAGNVVITPDTGVTIHGALEIDQYNEAVFTKEGTDVWGVTLRLNDATGFSSSFARIRRNILTNALLWYNTVTQQGGRGNCVQFNGTTQYCSGSDAAMPTGNIVASFWGWVMITGTYVSLGNYGSGSTLASITVATSGVYLDNASSGGATLFSTPIALNTWYFVVATMNAGSSKVYVNGNLIATVSKTFNVVLNGDFNNNPIGSLRTGGRIDQWRVYNRVVTPTEITTGYGGGAGTSAPPTSGCIRAFDLDEGTGSVLNDTNPNGTQYPMTLYNSPVWAGVGNGITPLTATANAQSTGVESGDGVQSNERGRWKFGDFLSGTFLRGITLFFTVNNYVPMIIDNSGKVLIDPTNTSETAAGLSPLSVNGGASFGAYSKTNAAPTNGVAISGSVLIGTATDNGVDKLQIVGSGNFTNAVKSASQYLGIVTKTADYTATLSDHTILVDATGGNRIITLPPYSTAVGIDYVIKKIDASANTVTVKGNVAELVDGANTQVITAQWAVKRPQAYSAGWALLTN